MTVAVLRNGLRVLIEPVRGVRTVSVGVWFAAGSRQDPPGQAGTAHLLEHLVFKGSGARSALALARAMDALGGQFNAFTTRENTCFHARTLGNRCDLAVELLAEMVVAPRLDAADVERERLVVQDELAMIADDPGETADEAFARALWGDHPLAQPQAGTPTSVAGLEAAALSAFHRAHYVGRRAVVAVAGRVHPDEVLAAVERCFGAFPAGEPPGPCAPPRAGAQAMRLRRTTEQAHLVFGTAAPSQVDEARWDAGLLASILGGSPSSRLFQAVREERGLCYDIGATYGEWADAGELVVFLSCGPRQAQTAATLALDEIRRLCSAGVPREEFRRHVDQFIASVWMGMESTEARMTRLGRQAVAGLPLLGPREVVARIRACTPRSVKQLAERLGDPGAWAAAYVAPKGRAPEPWAWAEQ